MTAVPLNAELAAIGGRTFDVVVVGAGINGAATASRLAGEGYSVLLVDRWDFGAGSSSRSSRILHCGLNYLAMAWDAPRLSDKLRHMALARKMMQERAALGQLLAARVVPRTFVIPLRKGDAIRPWQLDAAFAALRSLGGYRSSLDYRRASGKALDSDPLAKWFGPALTGLASFTEMVFEWPERICVDYALEAAAHGGFVRNYTSVVGSMRQGEHWRVQLRDVSEPCVEVGVQARAIVNAAGVWSDEVNSLCMEGAPRTVTPNKGCHIAARLPPEFRGKGIICRNAIGHLFLSVPWRDFHILGPTETVVNEPLEMPQTCESDVDSILAGANAVLPELGLSRRDAMFQWAGFRPATFDPGNPRGSWERKIHQLSGENDPLLVSLAWGRLADHRLSAEDILSRVRARLGPALMQPRKAPKQAARPPKESLQEFVGVEGARTVADVLFRRAGWGWHSDLGAQRVPEVAAALAARHGISADELRAEHEAFIRRTFSLRQD